MKRRAIRILCLCSAVLAAGDAGACGNETQMQQASHQLVRKAEEALAQGRNRRAMLLLDHTYAKDRALGLRITRVAAVAEMRYLKSWDTDDPKYHVAPLKALRQLLKGAPDDPYLRARVAEALSYKPGGDDEALTLLADLAERDLMPDAEAWATLALLRGRRGDEAGRAAAMERCARISPETSARCGK